ncbi:MAG TPA: GAF domain-containing sensor histidine kinase [Anaerolineales bacterium]|nr:GAF domain-containing sensor histidine kinase [Anaerolineales bacterium]
MVLLTREQIEARLVALHRASLELVSDLSLDVVLERIVHLAREQAGARYAALGVQDESGKLVRFIPVGMTADEAHQIAHPPIGLGLIGAIAKERRTIRIPDIALDKRSVGFPPNHPTMTSFLGVPIMSVGKLLGQIYLTDKEDYTEFTREDERVIETLAAYAAVAIVNARMYEELVAQDQSLSQRNRDLKLLNDIGEMLANTFETDKILENILDEIMSYLEVEAGEIFLTEEDGLSLRMAIHRGDAPEAFWSKDQFRLGEGFVGSVAESGKPLVTNALEKEVSFIRKQVVNAGFQCLACIPMMALGNVVGVMCVATRHMQTFDVREINLLTSIGTWAGTALENVRLNQQGRRMAVLEERERIGMDLHDGIIQSIYAVGLALDYARMEVESNPDKALEKVEQAIEGLNSTIRDIRTYIMDLRPRQFRGKNLIDSLQRLVEETRTNTHLQIKLNGPDNGSVILPTATATALFHICQEALSNIAKHAQAHQVKVSLWTVPGRVLLEITDDGLGFDMSQVKLALGHGLANMHTRAQKIGGELEITSKPGKGTTIQAWMPLNSDDIAGQP